MLVLMIDCLIGAPRGLSAATKALAADATTISTLLRELNSLEGDFWIRLLYTHPAHWTDELVRTIAECPKVARYVDIPLQHIHQNMLERMGRETSQAYIEELLARIRALSRRPNQAGPVELKHADVHFDLATRCAQRAGHRLELKEGPVC